MLPARNDSWIVGAPSLSYYAELLTSGVTIYEYVGGLLHTKSLTVDHNVGLIGSANMDRRSFELNYDVEAWPTLRVLAHNSLAMMEPVF